MNNKPFWQDKTCKEMAGLHVKVTFNSGTIVTGVTNMNGDIKSVYVLTLGMGDDLFVPQADIESIELVDNPEYERIDSIEDVRVGDIFVAANGNKFSVVAVDFDDDKTNRTLAVMVQVDDLGSHVWMFNSNFAYALRPAPKLPDKPGLWLDKDDAVWCFDGDSLRPLRGAVTGEWDISKDTWGGQCHDSLCSVPSGQGGGSMSVEVYFTVEDCLEPGNTEYDWNHFNTYEEAMDAISHLGPAAYGPGEYEIHKRFRITKEAEA